MRNQSENFSTVFHEFLNSYLPSDKESHSNHQNQSDELLIARANEIKVIKSFLAHPCKCGKNCQLQFTEKELLKSREDFRQLSLDQKNCFMLSQLSCFH